LKTILEFPKIGRFVAASALLCLIFFAATGADAEKMVFSKDSLYHRILVHDDGSIRTLSFGKGPGALRQSVIDIEDLDRLFLDYSKTVFAGLLLDQDPTKVLIIGLGGGVIPRIMHRHFPEAEIDVVEIDPEVVEVAKRFFFFQPDNSLRVHVSDGRVFVRRQAGLRPTPLYDLIILDAFNNEYIPFHLTTREFLQQVAAILDPKGVVVANVFRDNQLFDAELETFRAVYRRCYVFFSGESMNAILIAPGRDLPALEQVTAYAIADKLQKQHGFNFDLNRIAGQFRPGFKPRTDAKVLTDDRAPVNVLRHRPR